jgi:hypothetical protein
MTRNPADYSEPCFKKGRGAETLVQITGSILALIGGDFAF